MEIASIGSGSKGNATLIREGNTLLLLDCGFSLKRLTQGMARLGCSPGDISALLVTHEHSDHIAGIATLVNNHELPLFLTSGSASVLRKKGVVKRLQLVTPDIPFRLGSLKITPVAVSHDAQEPVQYHFTHDGCKLGVLTDIGRITRPVQIGFGDCDSLLLEFNYDVRTLQEGAYPPSLKDRIAGPRGHLSNDQAIGFLKAADLDRLKHLIVGHVSENNNRLKLVSELLTACLESRCAQTQVTYATQDEGFGWLDCCAKFGEDDSIA